MGVDGPRGRAAFGGRRLIAPLLTERVDVASARPVPEVLARLDARTNAGDFWNWHYGSGVASRGTAHVRMLAVQHWYGDFLRPVAFVRFDPDGSGSRVTGAIRPTRIGLLGYAAFAGSVAVVTPSWIATSLTEGPIWLLLVSLLFLGVAAGMPFASHRDRAALRALLDDVMS